MTDFESAYLFFEVLNTASNTLMNFVTIMFAMLVASYLVAAKLNRAMAGLALILFSLISFGFINELWSAYSDFGRLGEQIHGLAQQPTSSLGWHGAALAENPKSLLSIRWYILTTAVASYVATIAFFFIARRNKL